MPIFKLKNSTVASTVPEAENLIPGELALNSADGKVFMLKDNGVDAASVVEIGAGGGGIAAVIDDPAPKISAPLDVTEQGLISKDLVPMTFSIIPTVGEGSQTPLVLTFDGPNLIATSTLLFSRNTVPYIDMAGNSGAGDPGEIRNLAAPTEGHHAANKTYVDNAVTSGVVGAVVYKGIADASAADAEAATGEADPQTGFLYRVTTAGSTAFGYQANVGDYVIYNGTSYDKWDAVDPTISGTAGRITVTGDQTAGFTVNLATTFGLAGLADVDLTDIADGVLLQYNATSEKFEVVDVIDGGSY